MGLNSVIAELARGILDEPLLVERVTHVPKPGEACLQGVGLRGVKFDATVLEIEIRGMAALMRRDRASMVHLQQIYLQALQQIAGRLTGSVRDLRGDRLLIFFPGTTKAMVSNAVRCAMHCVYLLSDRENALYTVLKNDDILREFSFDFGIGLDYGEILCMGTASEEYARQLLWLGTAVEKAGQLSAAARAEARIVISKYVCDNLQDRVKYYKSENMWKAMKIEADDEVCYSTSFQWALD